MLLSIHAIFGGTIVISTGIKPTQQALKAYFSNICNIQHIPNKEDVSKTKQNILQTGWRGPSRTKLG